MQMSNPLIYFKPSNSSQAEHRRYLVDG